MKPVSLVAVLALVTAACGGPGSSQSSAPAEARISVSSTAVSGRPIESPAFPEVSVPTLPFSSIVQPGDLGQPNSKFGPSSATSTTAKDLELESDLPRTTRTTRLPERVPPDDEATPITGEAPTSLVAAITADLVSRTGIAEGDMVIVRSEFVIWSDGSLGCSQPGQVYTQAIVDGYWIVLEAAGLEYDYRANTKGVFLLCEGAGLFRRTPSG